MRSLRASCSLLPRGRWCRSFEKEKGNKVNVVTFRPSRKQEPLRTRKREADTRVEKEEQQKRRCSVCFLHARKLVFIIAFVIHFDFVFGRARCPSEMRQTATGGCCSGGEGGVPHLSFPAYKTIQMIHLGIILHTFREFSFIFFNGTTIKKAQYSRPTRFSLEMLGKDEKKGRGRKDVWAILLFNGRRD